MNKVYLFLMFFLLCGCNPQEGKFVSFPVVGYIHLENSILEISEIITDLEVPWDINASIKSKIWFTQIKGSVHVLDLQTGNQEEVFQIPDIIAKKSYGLLGMAIHPEKHFIFLHYTFGFTNEAKEEQIFSRLVRFNLDGQNLSQKLILLDSLPGATYHNGSRIVISHDDKLFFSLGDVGQTESVMDEAFAGGKIHRLNLDGSIPEDNPIEGNSTWAKGLRNTQGLTFGKNGNLYGSDHGPATDDEINLLIKGGNYGWPEIHGYIDQEKEKAYAAKHALIEPLKAWTPTIATAGLAYYGSDEIPEWENMLILASLKGMSLRILHLDSKGKQILSEDIFLQKTFGRIRAIAVAADGSIYFTTSNRDWHPRFQPWMYIDLPEDPDRVLRIRKLQASEHPIEGLPIFEKDENPITLLDENWNYEVPQELEMGAILYSTHCLVCHSPEGKGGDGLIPPISQTDWVTGDKGRLIRLMLKGLSGPIEVNGHTYNQEMPAFDFLNDVEIAELLTFIRNEFGNKAGAVIAGEVFEERKSLKSKP